MIDLVTEFVRYQPKILDYVKKQAQTYKDSDCARNWTRKYERLRDSANMKIGHGQWKSKLAFPLVKEQQILRRAITMNAFRNDPLYTLTPILATTIENAANATLVCSDNLKATEYRRRCWRPVVDFASKFGTAIVYSSYYQANTNELRTAINAMGLPERKRQNKLIQQVRHFMIHPNNYIQDPDAIDCDESDFQGHWRRWTLTELTDRIKSSATSYIKNNVEDVIREASKGSVNGNYYVENTTDENKGSSTVDVLHYWGTINISGNEEDSTVYYVEMAGDKIIRFQADVYDRNLRPYAIFNYDKRFDFWWGNTDAENLIPHENYMNLQLAITADAILTQNSSRMKFFDTNSALKMNDILNRASRDGWVGFDFQGKSINEIVHQMKTEPLDLSGTDFMLREIKESAQRVSSKPDLARPASMGGFNNSTATAANIISNMASITDSDYLESFSYGVMQQGKADITILQQFLNDEIITRPNLKEDVKVLSKLDILGDFGYQVKTSLETNKQSESMKKLNEVTQLLNFVNSGNPAFQGINIAKVVREWMKSADMGDIDELYPESMQMDNSAAVPSVNPNLLQGAINEVA